MHTIYVYTFIIYLIILEKNQKLLIVYNFTIKMSRIIKKCKYTHKIFLVFKLII